MAKGKEIIKVDVFKSFQKLIPEEKTIAFNDIEIKVKQYLDIKTKQVIIEIIKNIAFDKSENGVDQYSDSRKEIGIVCAILNNYTNINLSSKNDYENYDIAVGSGLYNVICEAIPKTELDFIELRVNELIDYKLQEIMNRSQILEKIQEILNGVIDKLPKEVDMQNLASKLEGIDDDKLQSVIKAFNINQNKAKK